MRIITSPNKIAHFPFIKIKCRPALNHHFLKPPNNKVHHIGKTQMLYVQKFHQSWLEEPMEK